MMNEKGKEQTQEQLQIDKNSHDNDPFRKKGDVGMVERQVFIFWQFNGDNTSWCNQHCPYCYGGKKENKHYWNGDVDKWEYAFERLKRDIYFVMSYGETFGGQGFYECVDMIGRHPNWTLSIVTNNSYDPSRLIASRLGKERRVFINACWHPLGVEDRVKGFENFKRNVLLFREADIPVHILFLWYKPQIKYFPELFEWADSHDIRVSVRRYVGRVGGFQFPTVRMRWNGKLYAVGGWHVGGKKYPLDHTRAEKGYLYSSTCHKVIKYGINCANTKGNLCTAGKDMILVAFNGEVGLCADYAKYRLGNIFDPDFCLRSEPIKCPTTCCGGDYGMLHMIDLKYGPLPDRLWNDTFVSQVENFHDDHPVPYPERKLMLYWLSELKRELASEEN